MAMTRKRTCNKSSLDSICPNTRPRLSDLREVEPEQNDEESQSQEESNEESDGNESDQKTLPDEERGCPQCCQRIRPCTLSASLHNLVPPLICRNLPRLEK